MPEAIETMDRKTDAVLWPATGMDNYAQVILGTAVEIKVDAIEEHGASAGGQAIVDREIALGSHFAFGTLAGFDADTRVLQVTDYKEVPDIRGINNFRMVKLEYLKKSLSKNVASASLTVGAATISGGTQSSPSRGIATLYSGAATAAATGTVV